MPDQVELVGEEELMPGKTWLVYRNQRTGQLSKVPREIMDNPTTGKLMMDHMGGYADLAAQHANPQAEWKVQSTMNDMRRQPKGHDFAQLGPKEAPVPQSPREVIELLRQQLAQRPQRDEFTRAMTSPVGPPDPDYRPRGPQGGGVLY